MDARIGFVAIVRAIAWKIAPQRPSLRDFSQQPLCPAACTHSGKCKTARDPRGHGQFAVTIASTNCFRELGVVLFRSAR